MSSDFSESREPKCEGVVFSRSSTRKLTLSILKPSTRSPAHACLSQVADFHDRPILFVGHGAASKAGSRNARKALKELSEPPNYNSVMNRFFVKSNRFELAPVLGYVPNNPMARRYVGGTLIAYHFNEQLAAEGAILFAPDLGGNDLKDLTHTLVAIANEGSGQVGFNNQSTK